MLSINELQFDLPGRSLLSKVSAQFHSGTITCLLGGNGSGKTTLLNLISGFVKPDAGSVWLGEIELTGRPPYQISRFGVARTFQDLRLIGKLSVRDNLLLALTDRSDDRLVRALMPSALFDNSAVSRERNAEAILADYFLDGVASQAASELSYGQQKLLTLACCAAKSADVLLLDEPVAGVSPSYREVIAGRMGMLKSKGKIVLIVEHQPDFVERIGDVFLHLHEGQLRKFDTYSEVRSAGFELSAIS